MNYSTSPPTMWDHLRRGAGAEGDLLSCLPPRRRGSPRPVPPPGRRDRASRPSGSTAVIPTSEGGRWQTPAVAERDRPKRRGVLSIRGSASRRRMAHDRRPNGRRCPALLSREFVNGPCQGRARPRRRRRCLPPAPRWELRLRPCVLSPCGRAGGQPVAESQGPAAVSPASKRRVGVRPSWRGPRRSGGRSCAAASPRLLGRLRAWAVRGEPVFSVCYP